MELAKEKRGHFLYRSFCSKKIFLTFVSYLNIWCIEYSFRIYILLHIKRHYFIHFWCLFLKSSKAFSVSLRYSSQWLCLYILPSKGTNQLLVLYVKTLGNIQEKILHGSYYSTKAVVFKCTSNNFFLGISKSFGATSKRLVLENYILPIYASDKDHPNIM